MEQLRLFFAIDLPEYLKELLLEQAQSDNKNIWRWTSKTNLHLTLEFLGSIKKEDLAKIIKAGEQSHQEIHPFKIKIKYLCLGPEEKITKRMIWAVLEAPELLTELKKSLRNNLIKEGINFQIEKQEFHPHITIARLKQGEINPSYKYQKELIAEFEVKEFLLIKSELKFSVPQYTVVQSFTL